MADDPNVRTFLEGEAYALVDAAVARETASRDEKIAELEAANAALGTKVDTLETEKAQALSAKEAAEQAFETHKSELAAQAERESRKGTRLAEVAAANPHLDLDETTAAERVARIVAFDEDSYAGYLADMKAVGAAAGGELTPGAPPRESAALASTTPPGEKSKPSVTGVFAAGRALAQKGA